MLKTHKNKGVTLIELMVAVGLGLILILSMLAFYSISSQNVVDFQKVNHDQQRIRKMMNLLETDIENIGGFECATPDQIYAYQDTNTLRTPTNMISLGNDLTRKQIIFVHPVISEYKYTALGMLDFDKSKNLKSYAPIFIENAGCGQDKSSIYIGATILEMLPMKGIITTNDKYSAKANDIMAFVSLSAVQSRRDGNVIANTYTPSMNDAIVMFLSNTTGQPNDKLLPFGNNKVDILLGFSPDGEGLTHVPNKDFEVDKNGVSKDGGWINPFLNISNYNLVVDQNPKTNNTPEPNLLSKKLHSDSDGQKINTYPLKKDLIERIRAIKFVFTFGALGDMPERKFTRIIRFKNTHLNQTRK